jgi:hypothetical protein
MVSVLQGLTAAVTDLRQAPLPAESISLQQPKGKNSSFPSLDLKATLPVITDKDLNLDSHLEDLELVIANLEVARSGYKIGYADRLSLLQSTLQKSPVREAAMQIVMRAAKKAKRLPGEAEAVLHEVVAEVRAVLKESASQRQIRVDIEYRRLEQGSMSNYQSYVEWKKKLLDWEEAGCETYSVHAEMFPGPQDGDAVKGARFGGETIQRRPKTWQELHQTVTTELQNRADSRPAGELLMAVNPGNLGLCGLCNRGDEDHSQPHCPRAYAQSLGDAPKCLKEHDEKGTTRTRCGAPDHRAHHHDGAMSEALLGTERTAWEKRVTDLEKQIGKGKPPAPKGQGQKGRGRNSDSEHKNEPCKHAGN